MKIGIYYGSSSGNTENCAKTLKTILDNKNIENDIYNIDSEKEIRSQDYDCLIFGIPTWGLGEMDDNWIDFYPTLKKTDLTDKKVAIFGLGDQFSFSDTFVDAMYDVYEAAVENKAEVIGFTELEGYDFSNSKAVVDNKFIGLVIDENNQSELTSDRFNKWVDSIL